MFLSIALFRSVSVWHKLRSLGGPGLLLLGVADNSVVPLTGSMDVLVIWLAARHDQPWLYYAAMATLGALIGGYITYALSRQGGKEAMEHKLSKKRSQQVASKFERWGFWAVAVPALLPPPFPFVPFLVAAGAAQYPRKRFLGSLALGRGVRYCIEAFLGFHYGRSILHFFRQYYQPALGILIGLAVLGGVLSLIEYFRYKNRSKRSQRKTSQAAA